MSILPRVWCSHEVASILVSLSWCLPATYVVIQHTLPCCWSHSRVNIAWMIMIDAWRSFLAWTKTWCWCWVHCTILVQFFYLSLVTKVSVIYEWHVVKRTVAHQSPSCAKAHRNSTPTIIIWLLLNVWLCAWCVHTILCATMIYKSRDFYCAFAIFLNLNRYLWCLWSKLAFGTDYTCSHCIPLNDDPFCYSRIYLTLRNSPTPSTSIQLSDVKHSQYHSIKSIQFDTSRSQLNVALVAIKHLVCEHLIIFVFLTTNFFDLRQIWIER